MGEPRWRVYAGGCCGSGAERSGASYVTVGEPSCRGAYLAVAGTPAPTAPPLAYPRLDVAVVWLPPAGPAVEGWTGRSVGDSGSHTGRGGVAARGGACLYCALKDVPLFIVVESADGRWCTKEGGAEVVWSSVSAEPQRDADMRRTRARACPGETAGAQCAMSECTGAGRGCAWRASWCWRCGGAMESHQPTRRRGSVQCDELGRRLRAATTAMRRVWAVCSAVGMAMRAV